MTNQMPMGLTSTPFISYPDINVRKTDLLDNAWDFDSVYCDVIRFLGQYKPEPEEKLISSLIEHIRDEK